MAFWDGTPTPTSSPDGYYLFIVILFKSAWQSHNHSATLRSSTLYSILELYNNRSDANNAGIWRHYSSTMQGIIPFEQGEQV